MNKAQQSKSKCWNPVAIGLNKIKFKDFKLNQRFLQYTEKPNKHGIPQHLIKKKNCNKQPFALQLSYKEQTGASIRQPSSK